MYFRLIQKLLVICFSFSVSGATAQNDADSSSGSALKINIITLGDETRVVMAPVCAASIPGIWFVHVHEDEKTAVAATLEWIDSIKQGCFITLQHGMGRNISFSLGGTVFKFDPNRMFTAEGRKATLKKQGSYSEEALNEVSKLSKIFTEKFIDNNRLIVALHNNTNDGGLTINSYDKGGVYARDAEKVYVNKKQDPDDFFYTTSEKAFNFFKSRGFNVLLQNNATVTDDGSLSVYAGTKGIDYINIEAEHGKKEQQISMLSAAAQYIKVYYPENNNHPKP